MNAAINGPDIRKSALLIIDMQNDFIHPDGYLARRAQEMPDRGIDVAFLTGSIPNVKRLAAAFRAAWRPVIYVAHVVKRDYSDAQFPYWHLGLQGKGNLTFITEGTWGARIVDDLAPQKDEHLLVKKGYSGFANTPLDTILRTMGATTCVIAGVTTCICISSTVRAGVEHNYRMLLVKDAIADTSRASHDAEVKILSRGFAEVTTAGDLIAALPALVGKSDSLAV